MNTLMASYASLWEPLPAAREGTPGWQEELSDMASFLDKSRAQKLLSEIRAAGETPRGDALKAKLFNDYLLPILQAILARKLKASYPYDPESVAERVWDTASTQVLVYLDKQARGEKEEPGSVCDYVATLTYHAISFVLGDTDRSYRTFRLRALDLMKRNERFIALWREVHKQWCAEVSHRTVAPTSTRWQQLQSRPETIWKVQSHAPSDPLIVIVLALLRYIAHPVPVEPFVRALAEASGEVTEKALSLSGGGTDADGEEGEGIDLPVADDPAKIAERREYIEVVLQAVELLDRRRRIILLLNILPLLCDLNLLMGGLKAHVGALLELPEADFARLWTAEKCSDQEIAELLETSTTNVGYLRNDARAKLNQHMKGLWD